MNVIFIETTIRNYTDYNRKKRILKFVNFAIYHLDFEMIHFCNQWRSFLIFINIRQQNVGTIFVYIEGNVNGKSVKTHATEIS